MSRNETVETYYEVGFTLTPGRSVLTSKNSRPAERDVKWFQDDARTQGNAERHELAKRGVESELVVWRRLVTVQTVRTVAPEMAVTS